VGSIRARSIRRRFFIFVFIGAFVVIAPIVGAVAWTQHQAEMERLERRLEQTAQAYSLILAPMIDGGAEAALFDVISAIVVDPDVVGVGVYDLNDRPLAALGDADDVGIDDDLSLIHI